jgi:hypothetical protein
MVDVLTEEMTVRQDGIKRPFLSVTTSNEWATGSAISKSDSSIG